MNNFHIGQDIVAIVDHSQGCFKKDDVFIALDVSISRCCNEPLVDIGIREDGEAVLYITNCTCGKDTVSNSHVSWFFSHCFAPLDSLVNIEELSEILNLELVCE